MATLKEVQAAFMRAHQAGDKGAAAALAAEVRRMQLDTQLDRTERDSRAMSEARREYNPTKGSSGIQNVTEGTGRGAASVLRAVGADKLFGLNIPDREEAAKLDAPLLDTTGGTIGNVLGTAAPAAITIPFTPLTATGGATALTGAAARALPSLIRARNFAAPTTFAARAANVAAPQALAGAATGAAFTEGDALERAQAAGLGAGFGAIGSGIPTLIATGRALGGGLVEPLYRAGRDRVTARLLERFADNPANLQGLSGAPTATGARLTTPEAARDVGLGTLQRVIGNMEDGTIGSVARSRQRANNSARIRTLEDLAGRGGRRDFFDADRQQATAPLFAAADRIGLNFKGMTPDDVAFMQDLGQRLNAAGVTRDAKKMSAIRGDRVDDDGSWIGFRHTKDSLDDAIGDLKASGKSPNMLRELMGLKDEAMEHVSRFNPKFGEANALYEGMSGPINRMDIADYILKNSTSAGQDFARDAAGSVLPTGMGDRFLQAGRYNQVMERPESVIRLATGRSGVKSFDEILAPEEVASIQGVRDELNTLANLARDVNGPGSQTMKMLAGENLVRRIGGPLGVPESFLENTIGDVLTKAVNVPYRMIGSNDRLLERAGEALLDPELGSRLISGLRAWEAKANRPPNAFQTLMRRGTGTAAGLGSAAAIDE